AAGLALRVGSDQRGQPTVGQRPVLVEFQLPVEDPLAVERRHVAGPDAGIFHQPVQQHHATPLAGIPVAGTCSTPLSSRAVNQANDFGLVEWSTECNMIPRSSVCSIGCVPSESPKYAENSRVPRYGWEKQLPLLTRRRNCSRYAASSWVARG